MATQPKAVLANAQTLVDCGRYLGSQIVDIPLGADGLPGVGYRSKYRSQTSMREAKRAMRQLTKIQLGEDANGEIEWFEGWASGMECSPLGLLSFGSFPDVKRGELTPKQVASYGPQVNYRWDTPEHRHTQAFQDWLYRMAEKLGYEVTDQDQTSRCIDCSLAIDSGSSTPDRFAYVDGEGCLCERCCNKSPIDTIKSEIDRDGTTSLNWRPTIKNSQSFDHKSQLLTIRFKDSDSAERFAKQYSGSCMAITREGYYSWDPVTAYIFAEDLKFDIRVSETWNATNATIAWFDRERQNEAWRKISSVDVQSDTGELSDSLEDVSPLLYWLAQGWIEECPLFESDMAILKQLIADLEIREEDLGLELTELDER